MTKIKVVHYINQFFGQIGGEDAAFVPPQIKPGAVGPGMAFCGALGADFEIVATVICGDNYMAETSGKALEKALPQIKELAPDLFIAGPAFNAGRYGPACGVICQAVAEKLGVPVVTGMYEENPGVEMYRKNCYIVKTKDSAAGMRQAVSAMAALAKKLLSGEDISPEKDNYFARGYKKNIFVQETGAQRAIEMILAKLNGAPYKTELELPPFEKIQPSPAVSDLSNAKVALVTDAGLTDKNNTQRLESARATKYLEFDVQGMERLSPENFSVIHGGYDTSWANKNPNIIVPLDMIREDIHHGRVGSLYETIYSTAGNGTSLKNAKAFGSAIAAKLKAAGVDAVILTST